MLGHHQPSHGNPEADGHSGGSSGPVTGAPAPGLADGLFGRVVVQGVAMLGVAAFVLAVVDDRAEQTHDRLSALEDELEIVRYERDRMQKLSAELATELDEVAVEAEIVRWQLAYTEERYARLKDASRHSPSRESASTAGTTSPTDAARAPFEPGGDASSDASPRKRATFASLEPTFGTSPDARAAPLDAPFAVLAARTLPASGFQLQTFSGTGFSASNSFGTSLADGSPDRPSAAQQADSPTSLSGESARSALDVSAEVLGLPVFSSTASRRPSTLLELESLEGSGAPPSVRHLDSQLDRDRAFAVWQDIMQESADRECAHRAGQAERKCRDRVMRTLFPAGSRAVECMLSGNAAADYVSNIPLDQLPTHSIPLEQGAVILCDRGLRNL
jgi:hypothetical protein